MKENGQIKTVSMTMPEDLAADRTRQTDRTKPVIWRRNRDDELRMQIAADARMLPLRIALGIVIGAVAISFILFVLS